MKDYCKNAAIITDIKNHKTESIIWYGLKDKDTVIYYLENYGHEDEEIDFKEIDRKEFKNWINSFNTYGRDVTLVIG